MRLACTLLLLAAPAARAQTELATWLSPDDPDAPVLASEVAAEGALAAVLCTSAGTRVQLYDLALGAPTILFPSELDEPTGLATAPSNEPRLAVEGGRVAIGVPADDGAGQDAGRVLLVDGANGNVLLDLTAPSALAGDQFGAGVALQGNRLLVGAPQDDGPVGDSGSAHLFDATTGAHLFEWVSQNPQTGAGFGTAVALGTDRAVVGEPFFGVGNRGTVYVFDTATGAQVAKLIPSDAVAGIRFGFSLAVHGDRLVIGAPGTGGFPVPFGVYAYELSTGTELFKLVPSAAGAYLYGHAVAIDATRVLVGAPGEDVTGFYDGGTYVHDLSDGTEIARLFGVFAGDSGQSVALATGQGLVTSRAATPPAAVGGSVHTIDAGVGTVTGTLATFNGPQRDEFGAAVAIDGDLALVGAREDDADAEDSGSVYVIDVPTGALLRTLQNPIPKDSTNSVAFFGYALAIEGDRAVVGYAEADVLFPSMGAAMVYDVSTGDLLHLLTTPNPVWPSGAQFGWDVDLDLAGGRVMVGAPNAANVEPGAGAAFVYGLASGALLHAFYPPSGQDIGSFGTYVALEGSYAVVGGAFVNVAGGDYWPVQVYDVETGALVSTLLPKAPLGHPALYGTFATDGTRVLVGSGFQPGAVWSFDAATGAELWKASPPDLGVAAFGEQLAIDGSLAIVGAPGFQGNFGAGTNAVYGLDLASGQLRFELVDADPLAQYRSTIAVDGSTLLVGRRFTDVPFTNSGSVVVYDVPEIPSALPYCAPKTSTAGCAATIGWSGPADVPTSGLADWSITASGVQGQRSGLLIGGLSGPAAIPFSGGTLCVFPPQKRGLIQPSGGTQGACDGAYQLVVNDTGFPQGFDAGPGQTAWYQWWYRDPPNPTGPVALSNALEVPFL